ncbi:hypothetical protein [Kaarinaea lacus]
MSKDVNRDSDVAHKVARNKECHNAQDNKTKNDNVLSSKKTRKENSSPFVNSNYSDLVINQGYLNKIKHSIGTGSFTINPTRVAEKLILFERQLLA